ncbi:MAG: hypothetical protein Kow00127_20420 [Bacteroidales bacterium]
MNKQVQGPFGAEPLPKHERTGMILMNKIDRLIDIDSARFYQAIVFYTGRKQAVLFHHV